MLLLQVYHKILNTMQTFSKTMGYTQKAGRKPKLSDEQIASLLILSLLTGMPVLKLARFIIDDKLMSYHIFRKSRVKRVYRLLREYMLYRVSLLILLKLASGKKIRLVVDGTLLPVANVNRARTQKIRRMSGKQFWGVRNRNLYSQHYKQRVKFKELYYGVLVMVVCDTDGAPYDLWFNPASYHEVRSLRLRFSKSLWLRSLLERFELIGDRGYRGCELVKVCSSKEDKSQRQKVEGVFSMLKLFNYSNRWRHWICLLTYLYAYAIWYSFFRKEVFQ